MWMQKDAETGAFVREDDNRDGAIIGDDGDNSYVIWFK